MAAMLETHLVYHLSGRRSLGGPTVTQTEVLGAGQTLPDLTLPTLDGGTLNLAALRGPKTLLFFWGSW